MARQPAPDVPESLLLDDDRLADTIRRLIRAKRSTTVGDAELAKAHELIREAADLLGAEQHDGPYWQAGIRSFDEFRISERYQDMFPWSPAFGLENPIAPRMEFAFDDNRELAGTVWFDSYHCGPPWDIAHGGLIALVYDEILGATAAANTGGGMTGRLAISYRAPVPLFEPIRLSARLVSAEGRKFVVKGAMHHGDTLLNEGEGLFIRPANLPAGELPDDVDFRETR